MLPRRNLPWRVRFALLAVSCCSPSAIADDIDRSVLEEPTLAQVEAALQSVDWTAVYLGDFASGGTASAPASCERSSSQPWSVTTLVLERVERSPHPVHAMILDTSRFRPCHVDCGEPCTSLTCSAIADAACEELLIVGDSLCLEAPVRQASTCRACPAKQGSEESFRPEHLLVFSPQDIEAPEASASETTESLKPGEAAEEILKLKSHLPSRFSSASFPDEEDRAALVTAIRRMEAEHKEQAKRAEYDPPECLPPPPASTQYGPSACLAIGALREAARSLDEAAAMLEQYEQYDEADQVRETATHLRQRARHSATPTSPCSANQINGPARAAGAEAGFALFPWEAPCPSSAECSAFGPNLDGFDLRTESPCRAAMSIDEMPGWILVPTMTPMMRVRFALPTITETSVMPSPGSMFRTMFEESPQDEPLRYGDREVHLPRGFNGFWH